jgi:hypothetical protein
VEGRGSNDCQWWCGGFGIGRPEALQEVMRERMWRPPILMLMHATGFVTDIIRTVGLLATSVRAS